jgi:hypothetical protein
MLSIHRFNNEKTKLFFMPTFKSINNMKLFAKLTLMMISVCSYLHVGAQITYNFTAATASSGLPANVTNTTGVTQVNSNATLTMLGALAPVSNNVGATGGNYAGTIAKTVAFSTTATSYFQIVLTPAAGYAVTISNLNWGNFSTSTSGPTTISVRTSIDNYATSIGSGTLPVTQNAIWAPVDLPLTNTPITTLPGVAITIRIYGYGGTGTPPATANWRIDDLKITATVSNTVSSIAGTVGQIPKYISAGALGNSVIKESTTGNIGIGTANPTQKLDINGTISTGIDVNNRLNINYNTISDENLVSSGNLSIQTKANRGLLFRTNNTDRMFIDGSGNIGIGVATPSAKLHTTGTLRFDGLANTITNDRILTTDASGNVAYRNASTLTGSVPTLQSVTGVGATTNIPISITHSANTPSLTIDANNAGLSNLLIKNINPIGGGALRFENTTGLKSQIFLSGSSSNNGPSSLFIDQLEADLNLVSRVGDIDFRVGGHTNTSSKVKILNNGNVGIGTATPTAKLEITGTSNSGLNSSLLIKNLAGDQLLDLRNNYGNLNDGTNLQTPLLNLGKPTSDVTAYRDAIWAKNVLQVNEGNIAMMPKGSANVATNSNQVSFYSRYSNGGQGLVTNKSGYIEGASINGTVINSQYSGQGKLILGTTTTNYGTSTLGHTDIETMTLTAGNVGIGTATPSAKLEVNGTLKITDGTQGANKVLTSDANGLASWQAAPTASSINAWGLNGNSGTTAANFIGTTDNQSLVFKVNNLHAGKLDVVNGSVAFGPSALESNNASYNVSVGNSALKSNTLGSSLTAVGFEALFKNTTAIANTAIGAWTLHENTTGEYNMALGHQALFFNTIGSQNTAIGFNSQLASGTGNYNTSIGSNAIHVAGGSGNTGIGFGSLWSTAGNNNIAIGYKAAYPPTGFGGVINGSNNIAIGNETILDGTASNQLNIGNFIYGAGLTGNGAGKLMIGFNDLTKVGTHTLAVNGSAIFTKAVVKLYGDWPDYVFGENYQLRPLNELEAFIRKNNHLPDVPSEAEIKKEGIDLGNNQALLLKKIEELTLYTIEANKKIEAQQTQIKTLEAQQAQIKLLIEEISNLKKAIEAKK